VKTLSSNVQTSVPHTQTQKKNSKKIWIHNTNILRSQWFDNTTIFEGRKHYKKKIYSLGS
jgi:hypothetical protein